MNQVARRSLVDRADAELSIVAQCRLLKVARSSLYWRSAAVSEDDLGLMRRIDELYVATPFYGAAAGWLGGEPQAGATLMRLMRIEAIYQKPNTSRLHPDHVVYPHLLRNLAIDRSNQVWCADLTYVPLGRRGPCAWSR
jgi:putative transposase